MLDQKTITAICDLAANSDLARVDWADRGKAPIGFVKGVACTYGLVLRKLQAGDSAALAMVRVVDEGHDVFDHYEEKLSAAGIPTSNASDVDRLRALFVILTGLGMRESSGRYCEGRDRSARNTTAETAEAGAWQQSWDSRTASPEIEKLMDSFANAKPGDGFLNIFCEGVMPRGGDLENYGSGDGNRFQSLCKVCPVFAAQVAAIGLRTLRTAWGPINRREVEIRPETIALFREVETIVGTSAPVIAQKPASGWVSVLIAALLALFRRGPSVSPPVPGPTKQPGAPWMIWARKEIGFHEQGQNHGIGKYISLGKCGSDGDPWCAIFVNAALESSGVRGSHSAMARSFEHGEQFVRLAGPAYGAIVTMWRGSPGSGLGHCFFYAGENADGRVLALGGNQSDQVCRQWEPRNRIVGYWWPKSVPLPKIGKITVKDNAKEGTET